MKNDIWERFKRLKLSFEFLLFGDVSFDPQIVADLTAVVFDKTGTITEGKPQVTHILPLNGWDENEILRLAASAEKNSEHALGAAIIEEGQKRNLSLIKGENFEAIPGYGLKIVLNGKTVMLGNSRLMQQHDLLQNEHPKVDTLSKKLYLLLRKSSQTINTQQQ